MTVIYMVLLIPIWTAWLAAILPQIPGEFLKGTVQVKGPDYQELGEDLPEDFDSVEMEEQFNQGGLPEQDEKVVVEINLE